MQKKVVCFGEVLWDVLPDGKIAGGAPMNVAIRLQSLGVSATIISKTGKDASGADLRVIIQDKNVDTNLIQEGADIATGEVMVQLDQQGIATYDIVYPSAWDRIQMSSYNQEAVEQCEAFVFGSLACRDEVSRNTLLNLLPYAKYKIFDVNLRAPFYDISFIETLMKQSDFIKLNDEELLIIAAALGSASTDIEENIKYLAVKTNTETICITKGKDGAVLYTQGKYWVHEGFAVKVADTVGSGDSFLAALIMQLIIHKNNCKLAIEYACAVGALVATHKGANPMISQDDILNIIKG